MTEEIRVDTSIPLERAIQAKNAPGKKPYPSLEEKTRAALRDIAPVPVDYHPGGIPGETAASKAASVSMGALFTAWDTIREAAASPAEMDAVSRLGEKALSKALASADKTLTIIESRVGELEKQIETKIRPTVDPTFAAEMRALTRHDGMKAVRRAAEKDARIGAAILDVPPAITGIDQKTWNGLRDAMISVHAADLKSELHETNLALDKLSRGRARALETLGEKLAGMRERTPEAMTKLEGLS